MELDRRTIILTCVAAILVVGALQVYSSHQAKLAAVWEGIATANKKQAEEALKTAEEAERARDEARGAADSIATENAQLQTKLQAALAKIPKPQAAPVNSPELASGLMTAGFRNGCKVFDDNEPSRLNHPDAAKAWEWSQASLTLPSVRFSLQISQEVSDGLAREVQALRLASTLATEAGDSWHVAHDRQRDRADALDKTVTALTRKQKADWWITWGKVAGGAAAGYLAGRAVR